MGRTVADTTLPKGSDIAQNPVSLTAFAHPPSVLPSQQATVNTAAWILSPSEGMGNAVSSDVNKTSAAKVPGHSADNPIGASPVSRASFPNNVINAVALELTFSLLLDLTGSPDNPGDWSDSLLDTMGQTECPSPDPSTPATMDVDDERSVQMENDRAAAELLQVEFDYGDQDLMATESVDAFCAQPDEITEYWRRLQSTRCTNCLSPIQIDAADLIKRTKESLSKTCKSRAPPSRGGLQLTNPDLFHPCFFCTSCRGWSCIGGDSYHSSDWMPTLKHVVSAKTFKSTWCCDQARLFLIFCLLCGIDPPASQGASTSGKAKKPHQRPRPSSAPPERNVAKAKKSQLSKGTGYGDEVASWTVWQGTRGNPQPSGSNKSDDLELYFQALSLLLPSATKGTSLFDCSAQPLISEMVWRSPMLQHASEFLRQAAIEEIHDRCGPITAVLDFLETMGGHSNTSTILFRSRHLFPPSEQLIAVALGQHKDENSAAAAEHETTQSLAAIVEHLAVPCRRFVEKAKKLGNAGAGDEALLLAVVQRICDLADCLASLRGQLAIEEDQEPCQRSISSTRQTSQPATNVTTRAMMASAAKEAEAVARQGLASKASEWHRANCVKEMPDELVLKHFHFKKEALSAERTRPSPLRMRKLLAQVSSLSNDLPDGIYVRHGESRFDVLKVLIAGPAGTPYEHGLFEFDMFCPASFPHKPPQMFFRTTGGGRIAFNPNLYPTGKGQCFPASGLPASHACD
jgi:baculoviral IAP repeat-containing protein 6